LQLQQTELVSEIRHKVQLCEEECARLQTALATVESLTTEYARTYDVGSSHNILNVESYRKLVQTVLTRDRVANQDAGWVDDDALRFNSQVKSLVCGEFADATNGLTELLQVAEFDLLDKIRTGMSAIVSEIELFANEDLNHLFNYVANEPASEAEFANGIRDKDRAGMCLADFIQHPHAKEAKLSDCEIVALRLYSLPAFKHINNPLRDTKRVRDKIPHPLPALTEHLTRALKKLRCIDAPSVSATESMTLWRGMKNLSATEEFSAKGGTELAPMSTTDYLETAVDYCMSKRSLIFCIKTQNKLQRGVCVCVCVCVPPPRPTRPLPSSLSLALFLSLSFSRSLSLSLFLFLSLVSLYYES